MVIRFRKFAIFSVLAAAAQAQQSRIQVPVNNAQTITLAGHIHPQARQSNDRGAVEDNFQVPGITVLLKPSSAQQQDLQQLLAQQQDPTSPNFHKWLTPQQYADRFGVSASDLNQVTTWLQGQGFDLGHAAQGRNWVTVNGTAAQTRAAFHTEIHRYSVNGQMHYANAANPAVPAALANIVSSIRGLNDFHPKPRYIRHGVVPLNTTASGAHQMFPDDFATIYNVAPLYQAGIDGTGQKLVVVGQTNINLSDIQSFRSKFNLPAANVQVVRVPRSQDPGVSQDDLPEADLDIEWAGAVARNASVIYVYSNDVWQSAMYAVDQALAPVLTMSYGSCEAADLVDLPAFQAVARQANAEGITWLAASGDNGAGDCEDSGASIAQNGLAVDEPGGIPEVTSMGGTTLNDQGGSYWSATNTANGASALSYIPEMAWNDTARDGELGATGGGASIYFARPAWQTGPGVPSDSFRHVPDVSFSSSADHDGYYVFTGGSASFFGGTSVAAPTMAGIITLLNHYQASTGVQTQAGQGNINPTLYRLAQSSNGIFHDVTLGNNIVPCASGTPDCNNGSFGYSAGPGYDQATGLGSLDAANFVHGWNSKPPTSSGVVPSIDQNPVFQQSPDSGGNPWHFKITLREEAGIGTTLTDFTVNGASQASQIATLFSTSAIPAGGSISAAMGLNNVAVPTNVVFGFSGMDAGGQTWNTQMTVPFNGAQVPLTVVGVNNAASGQQVFAPGMLMSVYGTQLGNFAQSAAAIPLPQYLAGFEAQVNGVPAPIYYVGPGQVNLQIPYETQPGRATLTVENPYAVTSFSFQVASSGPGIFVLPDGRINPSSSGARGQTVTMYITGEGKVTPALPTGTAPAIGTAVNRLPKPVLPLSVTVGGVPATVQFEGITSYAVGVTQINFTIPDSVAPGLQPVVVTVGSASTPPANILVQ